MLKKYLSYKGRSVWKSYFFEDKERVSDIIERNEILRKKDIDKMLLVGTGKKYQTLRVDKLMKGFKAGQFVLTKKIGSKIHSQKTKKKGKKK